MVGGKGAYQLTGGPGFPSGVDGKGLPYQQDQGIQGKKAQRHQEDDQDYVGGLGKKAL